MIFDFEKHLKSLFDKATDEEKLVIAIMDDDIDRLKEKINALSAGEQSLINEWYKNKQKLSIATKGLQDMADGKIPYTSFGQYAKQILEQIKEQK